MMGKFNRNGIFGRIFNVGKTDLRKYFWKLIMIFWIVFFGKSIFSCK